MTSRLHLLKLLSSFICLKPPKMRNNENIALNRKGGFTMLELLVAIAVTAILAGMLLVIFPKLLVD